MAVISYLTKIQFDFGAIKLLADEMKALGMRYGVGPVFGRPLTAQAASNRALAQQAAAE